MDDINYQLNSSINVATGSHCYATLVKTDIRLRDCSFEIREGAGRFEGRVIKFLTSFLEGFKIYNTCFGGLQIFLHKIVRI